MIQNRLILCAMSALMLLPNAALAQRTDGAEGSEFGQGGYRDNRGDFSFELKWGAALEGDAPDGFENAPMFLGGSLAFWPSDLIQLEATVLHSFRNEQTNVLVGPRIRTGGVGAPFSFVIGLQGGPMFMEYSKSNMYFGLSPNVGADFLVARKFLLGLGYAADIPIGEGSKVLHRVYMNAGIRFGEMN